jgi:hypothetical protein
MIAETKVEHKFVEITWEEWVERFKPIKNHITKYPDSTEEYSSFETYGDEVEFVQSKIEENLVWTEADGDMCTYMSNGYHYVNRFLYYVCTVPYEDNVTYQIVISEEVECECYIEDGYPAIVGDINESGDVNCKECEGSGYKTVYND